MQIFLLSPSYFGLSIHKTYSLQLVIMIHAYQFCLMPVMLPHVILLGSCFPILFHVNVIGGLEGIDSIIWEFNPENKLAGEIKTYEVPRCM